MARFRTHIVAALVLVAMLVGVFLLGRSSRAPESVDESIAAKPDDSGDMRPLLDPAKQNAGLPPSPLDTLKSPETSPENDVRILAALFSDYASVFKKIPLGTHQEIVSALRGENPRKIVYIPFGHSSVNERNEITDRWGKPFFFHSVASNAMEIISAGPDGEYFTDDDISDSPPHAQVEPEIPVAESEE